MKKLLLVLSFGLLIPLAQAISITIANKTNEVGKVTWAQWDKSFTAGPQLSPGQEVTTEPPMPGSFFFNDYCKVTNLTDKVRYEITINGTTQRDGPDGPVDKTYSVTQYQVNGINCNWWQLK